MPDCVLVACSEYENGYLDSLLTPSVGDHFVHVYQWGAGPKAYSITVSRPDVRAPSRDLIPEALI